MGIYKKERYVSHQVAMTESYQDLIQLDDLKGHIAI